MVTEIVETSATACFGVRPQFEFQIVKNRTFSNACFGRRIHVKFVPQCGGRELKLINETPAIFRIGPDKPIKLSV